MEKKDGIGNVLQELPIGFGMELAMNEDAMEVYGKMSDMEKASLIHRAKKAETREEMHRIVCSIV